jgi:hypothetical protein
VRALKFVLSLSVFVAVAALATGVVQLFEERPDGTARFAPHVSRSTAHWYASKTIAAVGPERAESLAAGIRRIASGD